MSSRPEATRQLVLAPAATETLSGLSIPGRDHVLRNIKHALRERTLPPTGTEHLHAGGMCVLAQRAGATDPGAVQILSLSPQCTVHESLPHSRLQETGATDPGQE